MCIPLLQDARIAKSSPKDSNIQKPRIISRILITFLFCRCRASDDRLYGINCVLFVFNRVLMLVQLARRISPFIFNKTFDEPTERKKKIQQNNRKSLLPQPNALSFDEEFI